MAPRSRLVNPERPLHGEPFDGMHERQDSVSLHPRGASRQVGSPMIPLKQLRTLQPELDWDGPGLVFTSRKACQATDTFVADQDASVEHGAQAKRIPWDLEFQELPLDTRHGFVFVEPIASTLNLRALRSVLHRCVRLLRVGGHGHLVLADPDDLRQRQPEAWPGDAIPFERETHHYRPWRQWWELLRLFPLVPMTPRLIPEVSDAPKFLLLSFEKTAEVSSLSRESESSDKYGAQSSYRRFDRLEEPEILDDWCYAASKLRPQPGETVLSLGCNDGRELEMFSPKQQAGRSVRGRRCLRQRDRLSQANLPP